jgi:hypothetical protein
MFFRIAPEQDMKFPVHFPLRDDLWLNCDTGWTEIWTEHGFAYIKGYCFQRGINHVLAQELFENAQPRFEGSFVAVLAHKDGTVTVTNDTTRATPLFRDDAGHAVGTIEIQHPVNIWADAWVTIGQTIQEHRWTAIPVPGPTRDFTEVVDEIHNLLTAKFSWLGLNADNIKVFYSGGIDTLLCISYLRALHIPHELIMAEHSDYDQFTINFESQLRNHWGYNQIHHYRNPTTLVTGACGDEYFLRGPATANIMLAHLGMTMEQVLRPDHYHYLYFRGVEKSALYATQQQDEQIQKAIQSKQTTVDHILQMCINDHQHWHLGHTITFTPFKDIQLLKLTLELDEENIIDAIVDASIQKELIRRNDAGLLAYLAKNKNLDRTGIYRLQDLYN